MRAYVVTQQIQGDLVSVQIFSTHERATSWKAHLEKMYQATANMVILVHERHTDSV
jgi:hypothetical protein